FIIPAAIAHGYLIHIFFKLIQSLPALQFFYFHVIERICILFKQVIRAVFMEIDTWIQIIDDIIQNKRIVIIDCFIVHLKFFIKLLSIHYLSSPFKADLILEMPLFFFLS